MIAKKPLLLLLVLILVAIVGCSQQPTPTIAPPPVATSEAQPTPLPTETATSLPAEPEASPTASAVPSTPTPAASPTATSEPTAEPPELSITTPEPDTTLDAGSSITVMGEMPQGTGSISVTLRAAGLPLAESQVTTAAEDTEWQATLDIPETVVGPALLRATSDDGTSIEAAVQLTRSGATSATTIGLTYPDAQSTVVAGQVLFFTGQVQRPADNTVTISVLYEECQAVAASTSFDVGEGGQWWGYVVVPETVFGPACAVAYTGEFAQGDWRAAQAPISILEEDDPAARGIFIGNFADSTIAVGQPVTVYGSAYNVPGRQVQVSLQVNGTTVAQDVATTDRFGYWEIDLALPSGVSAGATGQYRATVAYEDEEVSASVPFEVVTSP